MVMEIICKYRVLMIAHYTSEFDFVWIMWKSKKIYRIDRETMFTITCNQRTKSIE